MKKIILLTTTLLLLVCCSTTHARNGLQRFFANHNSDDNVVSVKLPKLLLKFIPKDDEARAVLRYLKSLRVFQLEALNGKRSAVVGELEEALAQDSYESLLQVNDKGERVNIYISQDGDRIHELLIMVDSDQELVVAQAKTKITFDQLTRMINDYQSDKKGSGLGRVISFKG